VTGNREPRDVEARLRASLRAYADAVDDEPPARSVPRGSQRPPVVRRWRAPLLAAAAVLAVAGGTWVVADLGQAPSPTAASEDAASEDAAAVLGGGDPRAESAPEQPSDPSAEAGAAFDATVPLSELPAADVGGEYLFDLYTHCGIFGADVGGVWFAAEPPLVGEAGPPAGWGDPYQRGTLTLESADKAVFRDDAGHELRLRAAPDSERPPSCD
jgi:hypothetical protein